MSATVSRPQRVPVVAIIGQGRGLSAETEALAEALGRRAIDAGFRLVTGGRGGVMAAASRGARAARGWREGLVVGILPGYDPTDANPWVDIALPTGLGHARNALVAAAADVVIAVGGAAGTLSEIGLAWRLDKPVIALAASGGVALRLAGADLDGAGRRRVEPARDAAEAIALASRLAGVRAPGDDAADR